MIGKQYKLTTCFGCGLCRNILKGSKKCCGYITLEIGDGSRVQFLGAQVVCRQHFEFHIHKHLQSFMPRGNDIQRDLEIIREHYVLLGYSVQKKPSEVGDRGISIPT